MEWAIARSLIALDGVGFAAELPVGSKCRTQWNRVVEVGDRSGRSRSCACNPHRGWHGRQRVSDRA
jgi:hypothetical protein